MRPYPSLLLSESRFGLGEDWPLLSSRIHRMSLKLCQGMFRLDIRKKFFTERVAKHWNRPPRKVVELPSLGGTLKNV